MLRKGVDAKVEVMDWTGSQLARNITRERHHFDALSWHSICSYAAVKGPCYSYR